mgnify:CR=1 FL=1
MTRLKAKRQVSIGDAESLLVTLEDIIQNQLAQMPGVVYPVQVVVELWAGKRLIGIERCMFEALPYSTGG